MFANHSYFLKRFVIFLISLFIATGVLAEDAADDEDAAQDSTSNTEDAAAEADKNYAPPDDQHANSTPGHESHAAGSAGGGSSGAANLAEAATDPSAILAQLGFFGWTESSSDDKNIANTFLFQPVLPLSNTNVLRPAIPVVTTGGPNGVTGLGDLFLLDANFIQVPSGTWGWGVVATLPTATDRTLGAGKWQAGPTLLYINKTIPKTIFGILGYNQWSFAGKSDRQKVNNLQFQPLFVHHNSWGYIAWTDIMIKIDWENNNNIDFPVGVRIGKVWSGKTPINAYVQPYYTFKNHGRDNVWGLKVSATFIKPNWLKH